MVRNPAQAFLVTCRRIGWTVHDFQTLQDEEGRRWSVYR
jgi:hypothetical protein